MNYAIVVLSVLAIVATVFSFLKSLYWISCGICCWNERIGIRIAIGIAIGNWMSSIALDSSFGICRGEIGSGFVATAIAN
jgi:hypothetical protein